jgi:Transposase DDE domain
MGHPTGKPRKDGQPSASKSDSLRATMRVKLDSAQGKACYAQRSRTIEPVFGQVKMARAAGGSCAAGWRPARPRGAFSVQQAVMSQRLVQV